MLSSGVKHRSYSQPLQRVLVDFGAEDAFNKVHAKLKEHYGISLPASAPRQTTLKHASEISKLQAAQRGKQSGAARDCVISETDGSRVPIVTPNETQSDRRKKKTLSYREARLTLAHAKGSKFPIFSATFKDTQVTGEHLAHCVKRIGIDKKTQIHCVGDGAPWIAHQVEEQFGKQATYLIDFYHVCEYLAEAATALCCEEKQKSWLEEQKHFLKNSQTAKVLNNLLTHIEPLSIPEEKAPVRACHRYLTNRLHQLNYKAAIDAELPIGSGEIESAHRYIIQKRLKIQGAWWLEDTAENMLALRTYRANDDWEDYWTKLAA